MPTPYHKILGLTKDASEDEIKKAYRSKALKVHPDVNPSPEAQKLFIELAQAYELLITGKYSYEKPKKTATSKKYWDVYQPPTNEEEYKAWKKVDDERREFFKQKAREEAIKRKQTFQREVEMFRKSNWYYPIYGFYYFILSLFFATTLGGIIIPLYVKLNQDEYTYTDSTILFVGSCTTIVSLSLLHYLKLMKKDIDPYFKEIRN